MFELAFLSLSHRTFVSFSVAGDRLSFDDVSRLILEREGTLAELDLAVVGLSRGEPCINSVHDMVSWI